MELLLVEDDEILGDAIRQGLMQEHYAVDWTTSGSSAEQMLRKHNYDMILLDLNLPHRSGLDILNSLRKKGDAVPVLILTARDTVNDRIAGLDTGADDYLVKPFDMDELFARIRALLRRQRGQSSPILQHRDLRLDPRAHTVEWENKAVDLPPREFVILQLLLENSGKVLSRARLEEAIYGWDSDIGSNAVEVHIHKLRKKFGKGFIKTVRNVGYTIVKPNK